MALAETARLIASLELQDKFSKTAAKFDKSIGGLDTSSRKAGKGVGVLGVAIGSGLGTAAVGLASRGIRSLINVFHEGVGGAQELENQQAQTQAAIKSTGGVAGVTADQIRKLAEKYEGLNATIDDKVIQSAENMLLTFTNVDKKAFQPAIQAALDMNTRFGGGEGGLQGVMIQLGKALNDPIRGITALRRVGVAFSTDQQKQIKDLIKQNDLYGAQKIVLAELNKEFGGSFLAQGDTSAAKAAHFTDTLEDLKITLAQSLLPGLDRVRDGLSTLFSDPKTIAGVKGFGDSIANLLSTENIDQGIAGVKGLFGFLKTVPWGTIAAGLSASASATKAVVEAFLKLPPGVQTAIIGGLAVNKLSGGVLGGLAGKGIGAAAGEAIKFLFKKGDTPANPLFVADVTGGLGGGVPGGVAGKAGGSIAGTIGKYVLGPLAAVAIGKEIAQVINEPVIGPAKASEATAFSAAIKSSNLDSLHADLDAINAQLNTSDTSSQVALIASRIPYIGDALGNVAPTLEKQRAAIVAKIGALQASNRVTDGILTRNASEQNAVIRGSMIASSKGITGQIIRQSASERADALRIAGTLRSTAAAARTAQANATGRMVAANLHGSLAGAAAMVRSVVPGLRRIEGTTGATSAHTGVIARKNFSPSFKTNVSVGVTNNISVSAVQKALTTHSYATATNRVGGMLR